MQGHTVEQLIDAVLHFEQRCADVAMFSLHAEFTVFVMRAVGEPQWAFDAFENLCDRDLCRAPREQVASLGAGQTINHAILGKGLKYFCEKFQRDIVFFDNLFRVDDTAWGGITELDRGDVLERHERILSLRVELT